MTKYEGSFKNIVLDCSSRVYRCRESFYVAKMELFYKTLIQHCKARAQSW